MKPSCRYCGKEIDETEEYQQSGKCLECYRLERIQEYIEYGKEIKKLKKYQENIKEEFFEDFHTEDEGRVYYAELISPKPKTFFDEQKINEFLKEHGKTLKDFEEFKPSTPYFKLSSRNIKVKKDYTAEILKLSELAEEAFLNGHKVEEGRLLKRVAELRKLEG